MIDNALFDWDGTLVDSSEGILENLRYAIDSVGYPVPDEKTLRTFIGPSLVWAFTCVLGMDESTATQAISNYVYGYSNKGGYKKFKLFGGVEDLIKTLYLSGVKVSIVSAKPTAQLRMVVQESGLMQYVDKVVGPDGEGKKDSDKSELIKRAINGKNVVMVGDSTYDITSAKKAEVTSVAVTYGFGFTKNSETYADYTVDTVQDLKRILLKEL